MTDPATKPVADIAHGWDPDPSRSLSLHADAYAIFEESGTSSGPKSSKNGERS